MKPLVRAALLLIALLVGAMALSALYHYLPNSEERGMVLTPLQRPLAKVCLTLDYWLRGVGHPAKLAAENEQLRNRILSLETRRLHYKYLEESQRRLEKLLKFKNSFATTTIASRIIARDPNLWDSEIVLDKGREEGVTLEMAAICPQGLVGRVIAVTAHNCRVRLIFDERMTVPVVLAETGALGVLSSDGTFSCEMKYVRHDEPVSEGQLVLTSGIGDIYPAGIPVGKVTKISGDSEVMFKSLQVLPLAELGSLQEVLLCGRELVALNPPKAKAKAASASPAPLFGETAEEAAHSAQVTAEEAAPATLSEPPSAAVEVPAAPTPSSAPNPLQTAPSPVETPAASVPTAPDIPEPQQLMIEEPSSDYPAASEVIPEEPAGEGGPDGP